MRESPEFKELLELYQKADLLELGRMADAERWRKHPDPVVTYIVDRNINYTNVCVADCGFCAFARRPRHGEGYVLSYEQIGLKIDECKAQGGVQILLQGGHNPYIPFEWYLELMRYIKRNHPIHIHGFSPSEVVFFSERFGMSVAEVIRELREAGLDSIPGGGGEILVDAVRKRVAPKKAMTDEWLGVQEEAHRQEPIYPFVLNAAICLPADGSEAKPGMVRLAGYALPSGSSGARIEKIEIRSGSKVLAEARLGESRPDCWTLWQAAVKLEPGKHKLAVVATDSDGKTQPQRPDWNLKGYNYNGWHEVEIMVSG